MNDRLSMVAHDLKLFLTLIQGFASLSCDPQYKEESRGWLACKIMSCSRWMTALLNDLTDFTSMEQEGLALSKAPVLLDKVLLELLNTFRESMAGRGVSISLRSFTTDCEVLADANRIAQVVNNLLRNAFQHVLDGGKIDVFIRDFGDEAMVGVIDDGAGIDPSEQGNLFEKFYRGKDEQHKGLGLGLYISKVIVEGHGGRIDVYSEGRGKGSIFYFTLPKPGRPQALKAPSAGLFRFFSGGKA